ncbi:MAG: tetratricopeptide repeat protein [Clostridia bacterium]|nr:tetratricopeptide repeat protein [Clostridia bacterium]
MDATFTKCESCSKEPTDTINVARFTDKITACYAQGDLESAVGLLSFWDAEARSLGDGRGLLTVLNEKVGVYRHLGKKEEGIAASREAVGLIDAIGVGDTVSAATVLVNCATTLRSFGLAGEALPIYERAKKVYEGEEGTDPYLLSSLYNNMATALTELCRYDSAEENYLRAIGLLSEKGGYDAEIGISYINLAFLYDQTDRSAGECLDALEAGWEYLNSKKIAQNGAYARICENCASAFTAFGMPERERELRERAKALYAAERAGQAR